MSRTKNIESAFSIKYETKYLFLGFIIAIAVAIVFIHILLFIINDDRYIGTTSAVLLGSSTCISLFVPIKYDINLTISHQLIKPTSASISALNTFRIPFQNNPRQIQVSSKQTIQGLTKLSYKLYLSYILVLFTNSTNL